MEGSYTFEGTDSSAIIVTRPNLEKINIFHFTHFTYFNQYVQLGEANRESILSLKKKDAIGRTKNYLTVHLQNCE